MALLTYGLAFFTALFFIRYHAAPIGGLGFNLAAAREHSAFWAQRWVVYWPTFGAFVILAADSTLLFWRTLF